MFGNNQLATRSPNKNIDADVNMHPITNGSPAYMCDPSVLKISISTIPNSAPPMPNIMPNLNTSLQ